MTADRPMKVLAVASKGGHWDQLMLLRPALAQFDTRYATSDPSLALRDNVPDVLHVPDANRSSGLSGLTCFLSAWRVVAEVRPDIIISTGAMPGLFCLLAGRLRGIRTVWIDSIANAEEQSMSGKLAGRFVSLWLTQWEHMARPGGPHYWGAVF